jgi:MYXO-CTERM domain-containing protein
MLRPYALPLTALLLAALPPRAADACGGTVCDQGPNAMPVDQTGENILFVIDQDQVEVHIQIQYDPDTNAQQFAWLIPLPEVPDFSVGSELLFQELLNATVPTYGLNDVFEFCGGTGTDGFPQTSGASFVDESTSGGTDTGVVVKKIETVGAFEVVVLGGMNAADIMQWLGDNGYQQDPNAQPILQEYIDEGNSVVAFKLSHGEGLKSIHPIVLNFAAPDGCVPIRLTRIAAVEDMDIRAFSLGDGRAIPTNYRHVLVNPLKIDWLNFASNYKEVVSLAVDAFKADGHAFVTEFAGDSSVLQTLNFYSANWDAGPFNQLGLSDCSDAFFCQWNHPLVEGLLAAYLPVPMGVAPEEFYSCLSCYEADIDQMAWGDGSGFAADLQTRVIAPAEHAKTLVETWPYLTRLYTTISPSEMTEDPLFLLNPELPDVPNVRIAQRDISCEDFAVVTLPDGRQVNMNFGDPWPQFQDEMPWEEDVDQMVIDGMPQPLVDNTPLIDELLSAWNQQHPPPQSGTTGNVPTTSDSDGPTTSPGDTTGSSTAYSTESDSSPQIVGGGQSDGCACDSRGAAPTVPALLALLGLAAVRPRRRRVS